MAGKKQAGSYCMPAANAKRAPIMCLFFVWRLHGEPHHAYSLIKDIREVGIASLRPSTVYALLASMEKKGLVKSHMDTKGKRARRLYQTTPKGMAFIRKVKATRMKGAWREFVRFLLS